MSKIRAGRVFENCTDIANKRQSIRYNTYVVRNDTYLVSIEPPLQTTVAARSNSAAGLPHCGC